MKRQYFLIIVLAISMQACNTEFSPYLGQTPPGATEQIFAPDLVSMPDQEEFGSVFSKDGKEFFYGVSINEKAETRTVRFENGGWTDPEVVLIHEQYSYNDPFLSPDEKRLYFISNRPMEGAGEKGDYDIWYVQREGSGWSAPVNAGKNINTDKNEFYVSFTDDGTMYFSSNDGTMLENESNYDIYSAKNENGEFLPRVKLGEAINSPQWDADVFVAPDESYVIFCSMRPGGFGRGDLYVSFRGADGNWTPAKNMGDGINKEKTEYCPFVSTDGKYLFYTGKQDIHWIDAGVIAGLR